MEKVLLWLDGKKSMFLAVAALVLSYLVTNGTLSPAAGTLIQGVLSVLAGGVKLATSDLQGKNLLGFKK